MNTNPALPPRFLRWLFCLSSGALLCAPGAWAGSFDPPGAADASRERALTCMTQAIAYEAGFEPLSGKQAVAEIILNRTRNPQFPASVCAVVYQNSSRGTGCQFTFTCDGSLRRRLPDEVMVQAREVASDALDNLLPRRLSGALNYHADYVLPYWAATMVRVTKIGRHIFYRPWGTAPASGAYLATAEPDLAGSTPGPISLQQLAVAPAPGQRGFSLWGLAVPTASQ